jgi:dihydrodipicolinate synthase/N-acetylneuraminate lyase
MEKLSSIGCHLEENRKPQTVFRDTALAPLERLRNRYGDGLLKAGLDLVGLSGGRVRPPRVDVDHEGRSELAAELERLNDCNGEEL